MKINVMVVGFATGYANWLLNNPYGDNGKLVDNVKEADIVLFTGGGDVHPSFYNRQVNPRTGADTPNNGKYLTRDEREWEAMTEAVEAKKPLWGTCRGLQLMCAFAGGDLIQHVNHGGWGHDITFYDGTVVETNTIHHQMIYPFEKLKAKEDYYILANSLGLSNVYQGETNESLPMPTNDKGIVLEPEAAFFTKINGFGQQSHLEMQQGRPVTLYTRKLVEHQIKGTLATVLDHNIPIGELMKVDFVLEDYLQKHNLELI